MTDELARAVSAICHREDRAIPEQLAFVGTGNDELICTAIAHHPFQPAFLTLFA